MRTLCMVFVILAAIPSLAIDLAEPVQTGKAAHLSGNNHLPIATSIKHDQVVANDDLTPIARIMEVQTTEDFSLNLAVNIYISESSLDSRLNSRSLMLALVPMGNNSGLTAGTPRAFYLNINCHNVIDFHAREGVATITVEQWVGFSHNEPVYRNVIYQITYQIEPGKDSPSPTITVSKF